MTETVYSATKEFTTLRGSHVLSVDAGTGSVEIQCRHGSSNYVSLETISADTVKVMDFGNGRIWNFVVSGDATFAL